VLLGTTKTVGRETSRASYTYSSGSTDEGDTESTTFTPSSRVPRRKAHRPAPSRAGSTATITFTNKDEKNVRRPKSAANVSSSPRSATKMQRSAPFPIPQQSFSTPAQVYRDEALRRGSSLPDVPVASKAIPPSITDIIQTHAPLAERTRTRVSALDTTAVAAPRNSIRRTADALDRGRLPGEEEAEMVARSSIDSVADEARRTAINTSNIISRGPPRFQTGSPSVEDDFPPSPASVSASAQGTALRSPGAESIRPASIFSSSVRSGHISAAPADGQPDEFSTVTTNHAITGYLRSVRITTLLTLTRGPHASKDSPLTVSLSDLGDPQGFPLVVFLGLGCVRHIMGLYDEMAECLGLRVITIDRYVINRFTSCSSSRTRYCTDGGLVEQMYPSLNLEESWSGLQWWKKCWIDCISLVAVSWHTLLGLHMRCHLPIKRLAELWGIYAFLLHGWAAVRVEVSCSWLTE
jgi:hypothetical protein